MMRTARELEALIEATGREHFGSLGFRKRRGGIFTRQLSDDVLGWIGLNRVIRAAEAEINPVVGVRTQRVERLIAELLDETFHQYIPPTVSTSLGYVLPAQRYTPWVVARDQSPDDVLLDLARAVERFALPYMRQNIDLESLSETLARAGTPSHSADYCLPVVLFLRGELSAARIRLDQKLAKRRGNTDAGSARYRH
jgi:hypothetical protein